MVYSLLLTYYCQIYYLNCTLEIGAESLIYFSFRFSQYPSDLTNAIRFILLPNAPLTPYPRRETSQNLGGDFILQ